MSDIKQNCCSSKFEFW